MSVLENNDVVRAYYGGWTMRSVPFNVSIGMAVSEDRGESFTRLVRDQFYRLAQTNRLF